MTRFQSMALAGAALALAPLFSQRPDLSCQDDHLCGAVRRRHRDRPDCAGRRPTASPLKPSRRSSLTTRPARAASLRRSKWPRQRLTATPCSSRRTRRTRPTSISSRSCPMTRSRTTRRSPHWARAGRSWWSTQLFRRRAWQSSSRSRKRIPASTPLAAEAHQAAWPANCSSSSPTSNCCMCPTRATRWRSPTCWAARST